MEPFAPIRGINQQLNPIQSLSQPVGSFKLDDSEKSEDSKYSFANILKNQIATVDKAIDGSLETKKQLIEGTLKNTHDLTITGMKAGVMLRLTTYTCSKIASACTTLFQMQI